MVTVRGRAGGEWYADKQTDFKSTGYIWNLRQADYTKVAHAKVPLYPWISYYRGFRPDKWLWITIESTKKHPVPKIINTYDQPISHSQMEDIAEYAPF